MGNDVIVLSAKEVDGATVKMKDTQVFAEKKSVRQSEFYAAYQVGLKPTLLFVVNECDYKYASTEQNEPSEIEYEGKRYTVIRTYCAGETVEITAG